MIKNIVKLVFLGVVGFGALVYFTADKPSEQNSVVVDTNSLSLKTLPLSYELVGKEAHVSKDELFKKNQRTLLVVGNHDSLAVVKDLSNFYELNTPYVMVANISSAPWFVKKMFIPSKLEELNENSEIPMIYDFEGDTIASLGVTNSAKTAFTAFLIHENGTITKLLEGSVKEGALDGSMSKEEKKEALKPLFEML